MNYFTQEHLDHIRQNGLNPKICKGCEAIDFILAKQVEYVPDLYEACKKTISWIYRTTNGNTLPEYISIKGDIERALAKVEG